MIHLALVWHHHQPLYRDLLAPAPGSIRMPWVRLHAIRDYFAMAHILSNHPGIHLTINFSPSLLSQIEDYVERDATDEAWELSREPAERLDDRQRERILTTFFDADWHNQIFVHPRYRELFEQRRDGRAFSIQDIRDLQVWFNLAWFGKELRDGALRLGNGITTGVAELVRKGSRFTPEDVEFVLAQQLAIMRAIIPLHRSLAASGQIELSCTPFYHPILPLLVDTDSATTDRPGTSLPPRFAHPQDANAHVRNAVVAFEHWFGAKPQGSWPAEGAVSESVVSVFARNGIRWIASDQAVLARSGRWGYETWRSEVRHRCYRVEADGLALSILFRDTELSDDIGFRCHERDPEDAARGWVAKLKERAEATSADDRLVTVVLDGENAWGAYRDDGRPFLNALYSALDSDPDIRTVTPREFIDGHPTRSVRGHPLVEQTRVYELFTGSWIDEPGSATGVDLGTWIGEAEENQAWALLGRVRADLATAVESPVAASSTTVAAILAAEGSDWFWWFGDDQDSGNDADFDEIFRVHLATAYRALGRAVPPELSIPIAPRMAVWTFADPIRELFVGDSLIIRTNCPGEIRWTITAGGEERETILTRVGGVMAGVHRHQTRLGPFLREGELRFTLRCLHVGCDCGERDTCCRAEAARIVVRDKLR